MDRMTLPGIGQGALVEEHELWRAVEVVVTFCGYSMDELDGLWVD